MHEHHEDDPEVLSEIEKLGYDPRDVPVEETPKHAIGLFVAWGVMMLLAAGVMWVIDWTAGSDSIGKPAQAERRVMPEDPYPLLQSNLTAKTDIHDLRDKERAKTERAGWIDEGKGIARIPIDVAMEKVLQEGQPRASSGAPASVTGQDPAAPGTAVETTEFRQGGGR